MQLKDYNYNQILGIFFYNYNYHKEKKKYSSINVSKE